MASEGARVIVNYKSSKKEAEEVVRAIGTNHALAIQADVSKESEVKKLVSHVVTAYGRIDVLVNNAGEIGERGWKTDVDAWRATIDANLEIKLSLLIKTCPNYLD